MLRYSNISFFPKKKNISVQDILFLMNFLRKTFFFVYLSVDFKKTY